MTLHKATQVRQGLWRVHKGTQGCEGGRQASGSVCEVVKKCI